MDRFKETKRASVLGIIGNIFLMIIKTLIGFFTMSQAMIADALNSAGDILTSAITYMGNKVASKPRDSKHNLGYGKAEYVYSMLISLIIGIMSVLILKQSIQTLIEKKQYNFSIWLIVVCVVTIITKLSLYIYTKNIAKKLDNLLLKANSIDHRNDCVLTTLSLISCISSLFGILYLDGIVGIIISGWIFLQAVSLFKESYDVLMDKAINEDAKNNVLEIIDKFDEIKNVTNFKSTPIGYKYQISFEIDIDGNLSTFESHNIADKIEKEIVSSVDEIYLAVIHVNPV